MLVSGVQQSDSVIHIHVSILLQIVFPFGVFYVLLSRVPCAIQEVLVWSSLVGQWLGLHTFTAEGTGLIPGCGTNIPQAEQRAPQKSLFLFRQLDLPQLDF